jgi:hypothetical protein
MTPRTDQSLLAHHDDGPCPKPQDYDPDVHRMYGQEFRTWFEYVDSDVGFAYCPACTMWIKLVEAER